MPRPISWLPRLHQIRRSVGNSVRSHYGRRELEQVFELQPRAAQKLLELLPSTTLGTSRYVERAALAEFLERVAEAEDVAAVFVQYQETRPSVSRRSLRELVPRDYVPADLASLPPNLTIAPGALTIRFGTMEELATALAGLAALLDHDLEGFARFYEPPPSHTPPDESQAGCKKMFEELEALERERARHKGGS